MITRQVDVEVYLEPEELALEFSELFSRQQAVFFSELAKIVETWDSRFETQLMAICESGSLSDDGRRLMVQIGEYAEAAKSCGGE